VRVTGKDDQRVLVD